MTTIITLMTTALLGVIAAVSTCTSGHSPRPQRVAGSCRR